jgi:hypothetical protein
MLPLIDQALKKLDMSAPFNSDGSRLEAGGGRVRSLGSSYEMRPAVFLF